ncbi:MAG: hypothetical protein RMX35_30875 [Nostoc sp. DcaGUA01]|nr:hypothetical protein [Nostoc sp. DcaGUA01]
MIAFLNLKFWANSEPVEVMAVPTLKANRRHLNPLGRPKVNKLG